MAIASIMAPGCTARHALMASQTDSQMRFGSCSTQPGLGKVMPTGDDPLAISSPSVETRMALELVVP